MRTCLPLMAALAVLLPLRAADMTTDKSAAPSRIAGTWDVAYEDLALGEIDGVATVEPDGKHVKVVLRQPDTGRDFVLTSESVAEQGDDYTIALIGESPSAATLMPDEKTRQQASNARRASNPAAMAAPSAPKARIQAPVLGPGAGGPGQPPSPPPEVHVEVPNEAAKIEVHIADFNGEVELKPRHAVETNRVELGLHYQRGGGAAGYAGKAEERLTGTWRFFADPLTWRDGAGRGRVGYFRRDRPNPNYATQSAAEVWVRGTPLSRLQLFAVGVFNLKRIDRLYLGVPTVVEAIFDEPQENDTCTVEVQVGDRNVRLPAHRDPDNWRRFLSDPFVPGDDPRPAPPPSARPVPAATDDDETHVPFPP